VVAEALGLALPHTALAPSGQPVWLDAAKRSAAALLRLRELRIGTSGILSQSAFENAMVVYAAFGGSTNLLLHLPAIAHAAGRTRPTVADWMRINREVPRLVDALPNGPRNFATVQVFLAGGVPEVMLHLRAAGLLHTTAMTAAGVTLGECLDWWQQSERRLALRQNLRDRDGIDPGDVIFSPSRARPRVPSSRAPRSIRPSSAKTASSFIAAQRESLQPKPPPSTPFATVTSQPAM
jgi:dihydroxyacid dehydratase/phosphogluconate dehydratase